MAKKAARKNVKVSALDRAKARWNTFGSGRKVFSIVLIGVAGYCLFYIGQIIVQKIQFDVEKRSIHKVYQSIITEIGEPAVSEINSKCNYQHLKFSRGDRRCGTFFNIAYVVSDHDKANQYSKIVYSSFPASNFTTTTDILNTNLNEPPGSPFLEIPNIFSTERNVYNKYFKTKHKVTNHNCEASIDYGISKYLDNPSTNNESLNITISFGCYLDAKFEFFPVDE